MPDGKMMCAYCGGVQPWDADHFPDRMLARCFGCIGLDEPYPCPRCKGERIGTDHEITKRRFWPSWMPGAWQEGRANWFWCLTCDLEAYR